MEVYARQTLPELYLENPYALINQVTWVPPTDKHWVGGIQYDADCGAVDVTSSPCISGAPTSLTKSATYSRATRGSRPFTLYAKVDCTPDRAFWDEAERNARRALTNHGGVQLAETFWRGNSGGAPVFPNLTTTGPIYDSTEEILLQPSSTLISGAPIDVVEALARLEEAVGDCYPGQVMIHIPTVLLAEMSAWNLITAVGGKLLTAKKNIVVVDDGYDPTIGPDGSTPATGSAWMFATSPVFGIRAPEVRTFARVESFDRDVNTLMMIAEQTVILGWECCLYGVLVALGGVPAGTYGTAS